MKRAVIIGAGEAGISLLKSLRGTGKVEVVAVTDEDSNSKGVTIAKSLGIQAFSDLLEVFKQDIDIIFETTGSQQIQQQILQRKREKTIFFSKEVTSIAFELLQEKEETVNKLQSCSNKQLYILENIQEAIIVIDDKEIVIFVNQKAEELTGINKQDFLDRPIRDIIDQSRLPEVLRTRKKELNQKLLLGNTKEVISSRLPILDDRGRLLGAFAIFQETRELAALVQKAAGLNDIRDMIRPVVHSLAEAVRIVDENGRETLVNPAYTEITGLSEADIRGQENNSFLNEKNLLTKVLKTKLPIKDINRQIGSPVKDIQMEVAPIIIEGKLKGSISVLRDVSKLHFLSEELKRARQIIRRLDTNETFNDIAGSSNGMALVHEQAKAGAKTSAPILLRGEQGTGKKLLAKAIHNESQRKNNKFIYFNCSAETSFLDNGLFGYEKQSFSQDRPVIEKGFLEQADKGSIFFDNIDRLPLSIQRKLLRTIRKSEIIREGGNSPVPIEVRVIASSSEDLEKAVSKGNFLKDLYYLLSKFSIFLQPLRDRVEDINELTMHILRKINHESGRNLKKLDEKALNYIKKYSWPGNVRELENILNQAVIYMDLKEKIIQLKHLPLLDKMASKKGQETSAILEREETNLQTAVEKFEKKMIRTVLERNNGNKTRTAESLGISIRNLYYKMEKYKMEKSESDN